MNTVFHIDKYTSLNFDKFEDSITITNPFTKPFRYIYHSCEYNGTKYFVRFKEQFRKEAWEITSKSFSTSLTAKKWESKLNDVVK